MWYEKGVVYDTAIVETSLHTSIRSIHLNRIVNCSVQLLHHLQNLRLIIPNNSLSFRPIDRLAPAKPVSTIPLNPSPQKTIQITYNRPHKRSLRIRFEPFNRILRIPRPPHHLFNLIHLPDPRTTSRTTTRHIIKYIPQLVARRRGRAHFELEFASRSRCRAGCRCGCALQDAEGGFARC